ncbi:hypothetical protein BN9982_600001 [Mycobacterium tuberculosis]|nr:hypothetical protein BN9982_600001 [Mycobacterium tuberculosis]
MALGIDLFGRGDRVADGVQGKFWKALESGLSPTVCPAFLPRPTAGGSVACRCSTAIRGWSPG